MIIFGTVHQFRTHEFCNSGQTTEPTKKIFVKQVSDLQNIIAVSFYDFSIRLIIFEKIGFFNKKSHICQFRPFQIYILVNILVRQCTLLCQLKGGFSVSGLKSQKDPKTGRFSAPLHVRARPRRLRVGSSF